VVAHTKNNVLTCAAIFSFQWCFAVVRYVASASNAAAAARMMADGGGCGY